MKNVISDEVIYYKESLQLGNFNTLNGKIKIGKNVTIGNGCTLEGEITIGDNTIIGNNVDIINSVNIGGNNQIFSGTKIGYLAQHLDAFSTLKKSIIIGNNNIIRENCTIHLPYTSNKTTIKDHCFLMVNTNIPHDATIHSHVTIAYNVAIGGHCEIFEYVNLGLNSTLHQHVKIGQFSMIGINTEITKDVLPFSLLYNKTQKEIKINKIGVERNYKGNIESKEIEFLYKYLQEHKNFPLKLQDELRDLLEPFKNSNRGFYS